MHIYFSGIGGAGIGPLALIAHQAGYEVSGSDAQNSQYTEYLQKMGIKLHIGQDLEQIEKEHQNNPIDWIVFSSAVLISNPDHPELLFAKDEGIKTSKRDECLNLIIESKKLKLIAVAGTHGKTTTTAMLIWILTKLGVPISYSVGAKLSFGPMGQYIEGSKYFVYECDEFDRNFLSFSPYKSIITVVDWDHHDIYPTKQSYQQAFRDFIDQSQKTYILFKDAKNLELKNLQNIKVLPDVDEITGTIKLFGLHNRTNCRVAIEALVDMLDCDYEKLVELANQFPGSSRRFERLDKNIYSDYAHTPEEITATIQLAKEISHNVIVVYEPLTNRRQHYMKEQYRDVFEGVKKVYWLPSYLAREDPNQKILQPTDLIKYLDSHIEAEPALANNDLVTKIREHADKGDTVVLMAGGGGSSLDEWARNNLIS